MDLQFMNTEHQIARKLMEDLSFCIFDLETTGSNHKFDKIIDIGLVRLEKLKIVEEKSFLINPEIPIPGFIQRLTNIVQADVEKAYRIEDVIEEIIDFIGDSILVAHNISFDVPFLNSVLQRLNLGPLSNKTLCTNMMTKCLIPNLLNSNLNYMSEIFNLPHKHAHQAQEDARASALLLQHYLNIFVEKGIRKVNHLFYPHHNYELDRLYIKRAQEMDGPQATKLLKNTYARINNIGAPFLLSIHGPNGVLLYSLPCSGSTEEFNFIGQKLNNFPWNKIGIVLFGHIIEVLINFNRHIDKLPPDSAKEIVDFLSMKYLKTTSPSRAKWPRHDFLIIKHLVPKQFSIFPTHSLQLKNQLVFRYPGHEKMLLQYIRKCSIPKSNKPIITKHGPKRNLQNLTYGLLEQQDTWRYFSFDKNLIHKDKEGDKLFAKLDEFMAQDPNLYAYPKEYI